MKTYAGIGSRGTWEDVLRTMTRIASVLSDQGYTLRSGHAPGADQAFELGALGRAEIFLPWVGFCAEVPVLGEEYVEPADDAFVMAESYHDGWSWLSRGTRALMARNMHQVLGPNLDDPVDFLLCWTPNASKTGQERNTGGTGQAIRVAVAHKIPVFNFRNDADMNLVRGWIG